MKRGLFKLLCMTVSSTCIDVFRSRFKRGRLLRQGESFQNHFWDTNSSDPIAGPPIPMCASSR